MPNGGHICCEYCTYSRFTPGKCDIFGVETNPGTLCRAFRRSRQSHREAREQWPILEELKPGIVYEIDNTTYSAGDPRPVYRVVPISSTKSPAD